MFTVNITLQPTEKLRKSYPPGTGMPDILSDLGARMHWSYPPRISFTEESDYILFALKYL